MKKQIFNGIVWSLMLLSMAFVVYYLGFYYGKKQTVNTEAEILEALGKHS